MKKNKLKWKYECYQTTFDSEIRRFVAYDNRKYDIICDCADGRFALRNGNFVGRFKKLADAMDIAERIERG